MFYFFLYDHFNGISGILTRKLQQFKELGFEPSNGHLFGFSFGAHVALESAYNFGVKKFGRVDACDPAGPLFTSSSPSIVHAKDAAKSVQCIHTSGDFGTTLRFGQKSINMGVCGQSQKAGTIETNFSHGLCPIFYANAFINIFKLVPKTTVQTTYITICFNKKTTPDVTCFAKPVKMGYYLNMSIPDGEYYSLTNTVSPYNVP